MARIRKHRDKWQVLYRDPATKKERSVGVFDRKGDATKHRRALEYKLQAGEWIDPTLQATLYAEWAQTWIDTKTHLRPKTLEGYESLFSSRILPRFGTARLRDIRAIDIEQWISAMHSGGSLAVTNPPGPQPHIEHSRCGRTKPDAADQPSRWGVAPKEITK